MDQDLHLCFLHIPKTGGSSLRKMLRDNYMPNDVFNGNTMLDYEGKTKEDLKSYKLFLGHIFKYRANEVLPENTKYITLLRNPFERVISLYYFWQRHADEYITNEEVPEVLRKGPSLAKKYSLLDFIQLDDPYIQQSLFNNQIFQLLESNDRSKLKKENETETYKEVIDTLASFDVVGVQELFPFFVYKFNKRFKNKNLFVPTIEWKNSAGNTKKDRWNAIPASDRKQIRSIIFDKNSLEQKIYANIYKKNIRELNNFFTKHLVIPQIYS